MVVGVLVIVLLVLEKALPARRMEITEQMEPHIKFPFLDSTVPAAAVPIYSFLGPVAVVHTHTYLTKGAPSINHAATLCSCVSVLLTADITNLFKILVRTTSWILTRIADFLIDAGDRSCCACFCSYERPRRKLW